MHLGSLLAAAGSYLDARHAGHRWLVRIEDLDTARIVPGAEARILATLEACGFEWDAAPLRQSTRLDAYRDALAALDRAQRLFPCSCTRKSLEDDAVGAYAYPGTCRHGPTRSGPTATRFRVDDGGFEFVDRIQGAVRGAWRDRGDVIVRRRDGIFAYQLAVVVDDAWQGVTDVVRGADLLDSTPWQRALVDALGYPSLRHAHLPVLVEPGGAKLAKSRRAIAVDREHAADSLAVALTLLGLAPPRALAGAPPAELWAWAIPRWSLAPLLGVRTLSAPG
ncbi:MAG: Glutamyl-Q tRNA(Asp) synthetase [Steroidobacteraceae bacterium]|nr:Glutamyl-Q tRNA(Asp) synthetase [Steroidobacteraceae bacterium]